MRNNCLKTILAALLLLCCTVASAHDFEVDGVYYNVLSEEDKTVAVTYSGSYYNAVADEYSGIVTIPSTVTYNNVTYIVEGIGMSAFNACTGLTNVTIPNSVTSIGGSAFSGCTGLTSITIPNSVTSIGSSAFSGCTGLTSITIPNSVTTIEWSAFSDCTGLTSITIPNSVTTIGSSAFYNTAWYNNQPDGVVYAGKVLYAYKGTMPANTSITIEEGTLGIAVGAFERCTGLTSVTIPNSVTTIGGSALNGCTGLTSITIPNSVTLIEYNAFRGCTGLTNVTIGNSVTSIGNSAFYGCTGLTSVTIPNSVTSIEGGAFNGCTGLTSVTIPNSVTSIGYSAFESCTSLTSVTIPNSVTSIGYSAFESCTSLTSVTIPNSVTSIGESAFYNTAWYNNQPDGVVYAGKVLYAYKGTMPANTSITIEEGTLKIAVSAFNGCTGLTSITIPNSVTLIEYNAFRGCTGLTNVTIGNSVTSIGNSAFYGCTGLTSVTIPNSVTSIGYSAFAGCTGLKSVTIGNSVTSIGYRAFYSCTGLTSVEIPNSVTSIGMSAFESCTGLTSITIPNSVTSIEYGAFGNCPLEKVKINTTTVGSWFKGRTWIKEIIIGDSVTSIGDDAFRGCTGLTSVTIPNSVTTIGDYAFYYCTGLASVTIGNRVMTIGEFAFSKCTGLTSVAIPNSVTTIGNYAFQYSDLREIHIPASVESIGDYAFTWNLNLQGITMDSDNKVYNIPANSNVIMRGDSVVFGWQGAVIPENAVAIGNGAFNSVKGITSVTIPASVTSIGEWAFEACSDLTEIYCLSRTPATISSTTFKGLYDIVTLYVPVDSKAAYQAANYWKNFTNIVEIIVPGDIDGDGTVDVADVTALVEVILNGEETEETPTEQTFEDWTSTNAGVSSSTSQNSYTLEAAEGSVLTFDWSVSSESNYDWLIITLDGTQILKKSGSYSGSYEHTFTAAGTHTLVAKYTKDGSVNNGNDQGKIYNIKLSGSASSKNNSTADVDGDGTVDVADVTSLVNIILFGNNESDDTAGETIGIPQDLGLSVKWASYNVGAIAAWESGDYYAWGETEEKEEYSQSTYKFSGSSGFGQFTKYYYDNTLGLGGDGKTKLDYEDDVARVKWGGSWRMPTNGELDELRDKCTWEWETLYGVKGYRVTGPNGNSIFLPAVGYRTGTEINSQQKIYYWSSTVYVIGGYTDAYIIDETYAGDDYFFDAVWGRYCGLPVRPVCE